MPVCFNHASQQGTPRPVPKPRELAGCAISGCVGTGLFEDTGDGSPPPEAEPVPDAGGGEILRGVSSISDGYIPHVKRGNSIVKGDDR